MDAEASRPDDSDIMAHEREVHDEASACALVGPKLALDALKEQYADNPGFLRKVDDLQKRFDGMRRTRPDGNCFYRAYLFGVFEQLVGQKERYANFTARAKESLAFCVEAGYEKVAIEDFHEEFMSCLERLAAEGADASTAEAALEESDGYLVCWARVLTSAYLKRHQEDYAPFLSSHATIAEFCAQEVDPMATEADHLQITALSNHLGVPVRVVYLDRSEGDAAAQHLFEGGAEPAPFTVHLLYRPGHYDVIYPL
mmetsp:Transcript_50291/g.129617  ORF Transcript_50291/g.129617 Transcript_50291/m.129617 type:complete len:256 (-) Transcript_50291:67-834(-)